MEEKVHASSNHVTLSAPAVGFVVLAEDVDVLDELGIGLVGQQIELKLKEQGRTPQQHAGLAQQHDG